MFHLAGQIFFGLIIGTLAKLIMRGRYPGGVIVTALFGLAGSAIGTFVAYIFFGGQHSAGWILSTLGAIAILVIYRLAIGNRPDYQQSFFK
jgi:uncharacterized membrane protein YeaQ/YmgE (transglycosylase-associated protein family)